MTAFKKTSGLLIYVGPTLSHGRLQHAQGFINGFPVGVQELVDQHSWFRRLFVCPAAFTEAKKQTQIKGSLLYIYYNRAKEV
ncbi:hypothetical protein [Acidaminococcus provencensis]|uniref:hypothetical protein n=1 Tax=Acidaminococcus provencensis TaxID=2058289 RepID=UPI0022E5273B|nr:hypothetical protein [Acidaminococcus provencensis]